MILYLIILNIKSYYGYDYFTGLHGNEGICNFLSKYANYILDFHYRYDEYQQFKNYFIEYSYNNYKLNEITYYNFLRKFHREDGPARIFYYKNGKVWFKEYWLNRKQYPYKDYKKIFLNNYIIFFVEAFLIILYLLLILLF